MRVLVLPDTHFPFHHKRAFALSLDILEDAEPDYVISIGDTADFYSISRYPKSRARKQSLGWELETSEECTHQIVDRTRGSRHVVTLGNHDARMDAYLDEHPELAELIDVDWRGRLTRQGWDVVDYGDSYKLGKMIYSHDFGRHGTTAVQQATKDVGASCTFGHTHRAAMVYQPTLNGECHVAMNVGWLGDVEQLDYGHRDRAKRDSMLGFGSVTYDDDGTFVAHFHPIFKSKYGWKTHFDNYWYEVGDE